jgi:serine phosphatase RsbU (regulator of sigma subunit)
MTEPAIARLLVVDDNPANCELLVRRLQRQGHGVEFVEGGREALARLRATDFDLVLLDITMPGMDGYQVLAEMKADAALSHIPVVMVSALDEIESVVRCLGLGADDYLPKPFDPALLRARVESSLARKRLHDSERRYLRAMERELEIGRQIQQGFLPDALPRVDGWQIAARFLPARQVAGDFYDVFALRNGSLFLVVADVCDKGVGAALYMALFRSLIRAIAGQGGDGDSVQALTRTARSTSDYIATVHSGANMFATAFLAVLEPVSGDFVYVNAGHDAPMLVRRGAQPIERLMPTGAALGLMPDQAFGVAAGRLAPGDLLLAFTDGVTEAGSPGAQFGEQGIEDRLRAMNGSADELLGEIAAGVAALNVEQADDVTMLAAQRALR